MEKNGTLEKTVNERTEIKKRRMPRRKNETKIGQTIKSEEKKERKESNLKIQEEGEKRIVENRRRNNIPKFEFKKENLKIIPLGGLNEIGKNITVFEYGDEIIVVDCGLEFPEDDMLGVDLVIPDITYLEKNKEKIKGMVITHGHEDHIGAIPYIIKTNKYSYLCHKINSRTN